MGTWNGWEGWYKAHKKELSDRRKARYAADPVYRQQIIDRTKARREAQVKAKPSGIGLAELSEYLGVSFWTLNRWKNRGYIPVKTMRGAFFSQSQVELIALLAQFFQTYPKRSAAMHQPELEHIVQVIHHNWA